MTTSIPSTLTLNKQSFTPSSTIFKSNKQPSGRMVQGGRVDDFGNRLGWWERKIFTNDPTDVHMELGMRYNMRPDLLAYDLYGKSTLAWFVLQYNYISDITDFTVGLQIILPTKNRLFGQLLSSTGPKTI